MEQPIVMTLKADRVQLEGARRFFARVKLPLPDALRAQVKMASDCEACLALVEAKAPVEQIQSAFASILANAKETWHLNGLFRDAIIKTAEAAKLPENFIANVMAEAERIHSDHALTWKKGIKIRTTNKYREAKGGVRKTKQPD